MDWLLKAGEFFGMFGRVRGWLQGKKTYLVNITQAVAGLSVMLLTAGQVLDLVGKSLALIAGWSDTGTGPVVPTEQAAQTLQDLWSGHSVIAASFSAGFYSVTDAFSKMATYAHQRRVEKSKQGVQ